MNNSFEWMARYRISILLWNEITQGVEIEWNRNNRDGRRLSNFERQRRCVKKLTEMIEHRERESVFANIPDLPARLDLLSQTLPYEEFKNAAKEAFVNLTHLQNSAYESYAREIFEGTSGFAKLGFGPPKLTEKDMEILPERSFFFHIAFTLASPFVSKDDDHFYVHENPVKKDWVLRTPITPSTSWKGAFRSALRHVKGGKDREIALCGNEKETEPFVRGRLQFYTTFYNRMDVQVINPQNRKRSAGTNPIQLETVPKGTQGVFSLLYLPVMVVDGQEPTEKEKIIDFVTTAEAVYALLYETGFGAKTSSGMGRVKLEVPGSYILINVKEKTSKDAAIEVIPISVKKLSNLTQLRSQLLGEGGKNGQ